MKKAKGVLFTLSIAGIFAFTAFQNTVITGTITPVDAATHVWAIMGTDTFSGSILQNHFEITKIKAGTYKLVVEAAPPYKNGVKENITAKEGGVVDVGEITLKKH